MAKCELCPKDAVPADQIDNPIYVMLELCVECWRLFFHVEVDVDHQIAG